MTDEKKTEELTDRELLLRILDRQTEIQDKIQRIEKRLEDGDDRFRNLDGNVGLAMNSLRELCLARGLDAAVAKIDAALDDWGKANGAGNHDEPTDPGPLDPP